MKTKLLTGLSLILFVVTGFVAAADGEQKGNSKQAGGQRGYAPRTGQAQGPQSRTSTSPRSREQVHANRDQLYREMLSKRAEAHRAAMEELEAIKKIAEEEGAVKTVEALQAMIDKKNDEYKKGIERFERMRRDRVEKIEKRQNQSDDEGQSDTASEDDETDNGEQTENSQG